ncbi:MAG: pentapeptide repeat-containing protein [Xenococcus sp. (in: cyanobacteria)]
MVNPEHLAKLQEGVEAWNKWRENHPDVEPNLSGANLRNFNLTGANLFFVNLDGADLKGANLKDAILESANFTGANLKGLDLTGTDLTGTDLTGTDLTGTDLTGTNLFGVSLDSSILCNAKLEGAILKSASLVRADLTGANLFFASLVRADLTGTNLTDADLNRVQVLVTNFEGATLTGACIEDWNINSQTNLQNVKCDYIYLKTIYSEEENKWIFGDRVPHDPDKIFAPGEFTKRYQKILETVNLYFGEGIDWQVFLNSFQKLEEEEKIKIADGEREIPIVQGIENTGDGSFVIKIGVSPDTDKGEIEKSFWQKYQRMLDEAEEKYRLLISYKDEQLAIYQQQNTNLNEILKLLASKPTNIQNIIDNQLVQGDNNMTGDQKGNFGIGQMSGGTISGNAKVAGVINEAAQQDLAQAAAEIQQLLDQLSKTYPTENPLEQMTVGVKLAEEIKNNPTRWQKVINVIKAMGIEALAEAVNNPIFNIAKAGIEAALESE